MSNKYPGGIITSGANAGYSVAFDGTGDYLTIPSNAAFSFGTGDFQIEFFVYARATGLQRLVFFTVTDVNQVSIGVFNNYEITYFDGTNTRTIGTVTANTWNHVAVAKSSGTVTCWLNGTRTVNALTDNSNSSSNRAVALGGSDTGTSPFTGYLSNVRILKGGTTYSGATINVPTQLLNITNTQLLTCNSPAIVDQSSNAFTITANGNAAVSTFTPFVGYQGFNPALGAATPGIWTVSDAIQAAQTRRWNMYDPYFNLTTLLLHGNGTNGAQNNTFLDSSSNNFTITRNGNTTQGTFSPFSQTGWGQYFGGNGNYLSTSNTSIITYGTGAYTVEFWINVSKYTAGVAPHVFGCPSVAGFPQASITSSGFMELSKSGATTILTSTTAIPLNQWAHVALVRTSTATNGLTWYINGVAAGTGTDGNNYSGATNLLIGGTTTTPGTDWTMTGYLSNFRICKAAVYTSNFTPSTTPLTTTSQGATSCVLLTCQDNRFLDNSVTATSFTNATSTIQAFSPFYPVVAYTPQAQGGSGYFDGNGDYLSIADNAAFDVGSGDFTFEAWVYTTAFDSQYNVIASHWPNSGTQSWIMRLTSTYIGFVANISGTQIYNFTTTVNLNEWMHICFTRSGTTLTGYKNGVQVGATQTITGTIGNGTGDVTVGVLSDLNNTTDHTGYISGLRIIKGTATAPTITSPPTNVTNTSLLLNFTNAGITDATAKNDLETVGNAQISTTQSKFGGSSLLFNGSSDYLVSTAANTRNLVNFGTGDFTVECWVYFNGTGTNQGFLDSATSTSSGTSGQWFFNRTSAGNLQYGQHGVGAIISAAWSVSTGVWYHIAICRSSGQSRLFANGVQLGSTTSDTVNYNNAGSLQVGVNATPYWMNGYIDEIRISRYARYTGNFTPQTSQWQDQ